jgi:hypothetical protein
LETGKVAAGIEPVEPVEREGSVESDSEPEGKGSEGHHRDDRSDDSLDDSSIIEVEAGKEGHNPGELSVIVLEEESDKEQHEILSSLKGSAKIDCRSGDSGSEDEEDELNEETSEAGASSKSHGLSSVATRTGRLPVERVVPLAPFELLSALDHIEYNPHTIGLERCNHWIAHTLPQIEELEEGEVLDIGEEISMGTH